MMGDDRDDTDYDDNSDDDNDDDYGVGKDEY